MTPKKQINTSLRKRVVVVGGGVVGVSTALVLQRSGHQVTLIDKAKPGRATSYGNAGVLSESSVAVINGPQIFRQMPKLVFGGSNALRYSPFFVLKRAIWVTGFLARGTRARWNAAARALRSLQVLSLSHHKKWIAEAGVDEMFREGAWMKVFRTQKSFDRFARELNLLGDLGVKYTVFDRERIRQMEPGLKPIYEKAVLFDETCAVDDPAALTDAYHAMFTEAGGRTVLGEVAGIHNDGANWQVRFKGSHTGQVGCEDLVIAAGPWSGELAGWVGYKLPLAWERGYHLHLEDGDGPKLNRAINDVDGGFVMAPMRRGVRITSGVEFASRDAPENQRQIRRSVEMAREAHDMKDDIDSEPWMGRRPTLVDSLPVIGKAPRHKGLWFNFGHQHVGLSMAPGSAVALGAMIDGKRPPIDMRPFRVGRFSV